MTFNLASSPASSPAYPSFYRAFIKDYKEVLGADSTQRIFRLYQKVQFKGNAPERSHLATRTQQALSERSKLN